MTQHPSRGGFGPGAAAAVAATIVAVDQLTKYFAVRRLVPRHTPHDVIGDVVRFTLTFNPGAAFGMHLGESSRWIFMVLTILILGFLVRLFRSTPPWEAGLRLSLAAVMGGAIGNFVDRIHSPEGVVDFIDVGIGDTRFWTFNVADVAVSVGAVFLVLLLWRYESRLHRHHESGVSLPDEGAAR